MIEKKAVKLTDEQRKIVEANHDFIEKFFDTYEYEFNINRDEYYDLAAIGLCEATIDYNKDLYNDFMIFSFSYMLKSCFDEEEKLKEDAMNYLKVNEI